MPNIVSILLVACGAALICAQVQAQAPASPPAAGGTPDGVPFDIPYGTSIDLETAKKLVAALRPRPPSIAGS